MQSAKNKKPGLLFTAVDLLALACARVFFFLLEVLPRSWGLLLARGSISLLLLFMPRLKAVGLRNLELIFPELSLAERKEILSRSFQVLAYNLYAFSLIPRLSRENMSAYVDYSAGGELLARLRAENPTVGALIPTLHFGAFELLGAFSGLMSGNMSFLARGFGLPRLDAWWNSRRELHGSKVFTRKGGYQEIIRRLHQRENVALLFDQNVKAKHAVFVDFFGIKAATSKTVAIAAIRSGAPILFACNIERFDGTYELHVEELSSAWREAVSTEQKIQALTRALHERVEALIRQHPEQWFWIHRRFKTRPPGEPENLY